MGLPCRCWGAMMADRRDDDAVRPPRCSSGTGGGNSGLEGDVAKVARLGALVLSLTLTLALAPFPGPAAHADVIREREWGLRAMHGRQAWNYSRGGHITVAVLDTGVYPTNADLVGKVDTGPDYTHSDRGPSSPYWGRHGTAMASIIAGHGHGSDDSDGVIGIAPRARILSIRVTLEANDPLRGSRTALNRTRYALANGIRYATDHGASIISMSLGGGTGSYNGSQSERSAIAYAQKKGVLLVASAGNDGAKANRRTFPAAYDGVLAVGAVGRKLHRAPFSNSRPYVRVLAPGVGIVTAGGQSGYASTTGTSASTAFVAGTAALIRSRYRKLPASVVTQALRQGTGRADTLDARRALIAAARLKKARTGGAPTPMASGNPAPTEDPTDRTPLYAGIGGGALLVAILAAVAVVFMRRRRRSEAQLALANDERARGPRGIDLGVPPVINTGRMPRRPADPQLAGFPAPGGATPDGNGHGPVQQLRPYGTGAEGEPDGTRMTPFSDVHPGATTETFGPVEPPPGPTAFSPQPPFQADRAARPPFPADSGPQAPYGTGSGPRAPYASGPQAPFRTGSGPQVPYADEPPYPSEPEQQTAFTAEEMAPPPPLPPEPGDATGAEQAVPEPSADEPPPLPPPGTPPPPPPPTVETPAPPVDKAGSYYQSPGSVWDTPKLWLGADTSATAPFEAEARNAERPGSGPYTERGTTGWATAAGWENATRPSDGDTPPTDGDDEDDRHL